MLDLQFLQMDFIIKMINLIVAVLVFLTFLRIFDKITGVDFKTTFKRVQDEAVAFSLYRGLLLIAGAILISSII